MESIWSSAEERIMQDVIRRINKFGKITSTADYQINQLISMGKSTEEVEKVLKEALNATYPEIYELYDEVANWQYVRNKDIYEQVNGEFVPPEENDWLIQISEAVKEQTKDMLENISQSYGFSVMIGNRRVFMPYAQYYQQYVNAAIIDIISGGFDYNTVIRRVVTQMTNSGLRTVDYASGWSNRTPVAVRRAIMTGISQITGKVNERNAQILGTDYYEVSWHASARPSHRVWQGKVYSFKELVDICGLGSGDGLCGWNCYHEYYPFIPGVSERLYSDEWLREQNRKESQKKEWMGKEYDTYEQTQKQRQMETSMRAQRQKVDLLKTAGADKDEIVIARCKYQAQLDEYSRYCKKMGLKEQRERIYYDMRGRVAPSKQNYQKYLVENNRQKAKARGIIKLNRNMSNGLRTSPLHILSEKEIALIIDDAKLLEIPTKVLRFNVGSQTGFSDREGVINIRGDILPDETSDNLRDRLSQKAVLAHEYYGHYKSHPSSFRIGDWRDEFRASYRAAIDAPNLSDEERRMLMLDAYDRAKESGVAVKYNKMARKMIYGYDD